MSKIRVLIVEDSPVVAELLKHIIGGDPRFSVVGVAGSAEKALAMMKTLRPDVISLDIRLPGMNGLDATLRIMSTQPTPIVVVAANVESDELNIAMNALRAGALAVVEKPVGTSHQDYEVIAHHIRTQLAIMSQVKVVRQSARRLSFGSASPAPPQAVKPLPDSARPSQRVKMVGIVASTGGPNALSQILGALPADFPAPILVVQHMTASFVDGFASWLDSQTPLAVRILDHRQEPEPGVVYLPPADRHLVLRRGHLVADAGAAVSNQRPSGTVLFQSMARELGAAGLGVLLTGMGADGAEGLLQMRRAGAYTLAEDASTAVVFGMPAVAKDLGAVCEQLPLPRVAARIMDLAGDGAAAVAS